MMQPNPGVPPPAMLPAQTDQQPQPFSPHQPPPMQQIPPWAMMAHQPYPQPPMPPPMWTQQASQIPPPQPMQFHVPPPQPQPMVQYQAVAPLSVSPQTVAADEIRSLWIGDLPYWMEETYLHSCFAGTGEVVSVKIIRNKQTGISEGYGFLEFVNRAAAERALQTYNGQPMPNAEQLFRLNWATYGAGERKSDESGDFTIFVGDLAADVTDYMLQETFRSHYPSVKGAKVVMDRLTGRSKGYGFVRFGDVNEQTRAMTEMNGVFCSTRPMRIGAASTKKAVTGQPKASYSAAQPVQPDPDPNNTTLFVGALDPSVTDEHLKHLFGAYGELVSVKIPSGKRCAFVQFASKACAEEALLMLNGTQLGSQNIRLSWGRKLGQQEASQYSGGQYGYGQGGYDASGAYAGGYAAPQDASANTAPAAAYPGYASYPAYPGYPQQQ